MDAVDTDFAEAVRRVARAMKDAHPALRRGAKAGGDSWPLIEYLRTHGHLGPAEYGYLIDLFAGEMARGRGRKPKERESLRKAETVVQKHRAAGVPVSAAVDMAAKEDGVDEERLIEFRNRKSSRK
jgi:hypothetical protein